MRTTHTTASSRTHALAFGLFLLPVLVERERVLGLILVNLVEDEKVGGHTPLDNAAAIRILARDLAKAPPPVELRPFESNDALRCLYTDTSPPKRLGD